MLSNLSGVDIALLLVAAGLVGFAKTAIGGVAAISVAIFAAVLPARASTGALLVLLLVGDVLALRAYRRHADWRILLRLFPSVALGVLIGSVFVAEVSDTTMRRTIGAVLLLIVGVHLATRNRSADATGNSGHAARPFGTGWRHHALTGFFGLTAGFTTMVANAGGAVMSLYLLAMGLSMLGFLGTAAWFFFLVNIFKTPFSIRLGLITTDTLVLGAVLAPAVVLGGWAGRRVIDRLDQQLFERLVLVFTVLSALNLLR